MRRSFRSGIDRIQSNITRRWLTIVIVSILLVVIASRIAYLLIFKGYVWPEWTGFVGFRDPSGEYHPAKTLWDWLELLIIPAVLGIGALLFNKAARDRQQEIAEDQQREEALQNYLDKMAELLLEKELLKKKDDPDDPIVGVGQVRTVTTLKILDQHRRDILLQFLRDANLGNSILVGASLKRVNLSYTHLIEINLSWARLYKADLRGADLRRADLRRAELRRAKINDKTDIDEKWRLVWKIVTRDAEGRYLSGKDLSAAKLSEAILRGADLSNADLRRADLCRADLCGANLRGTDLSDVDLTGAKYDGQTKWPEGFDYKNSGTIGPGANLREADLSGFDLSSADMRGANLSGADLSNANLSGTQIDDKWQLVRQWVRKIVTLSAAGRELRGADLSRANLSRANLSEANLREADLLDADLREADLSRADLTGAKVSQDQIASVKCLKGATMPDGTVHE